MPIETFKLPGRDMIDDQHGLRNVEPEGYKTDAPPIKQNVILVPPDLRENFLTQEHVEHIRIQGDDCDFWQDVDPRERELLRDFLREAKHTRKKSQQLAPGSRIGYDKTGVFLHEHHVRRYYGIARENAHRLKASLSLLLACPEAVAECVDHKVAAAGDDPTTKFMTRMSCGLVNLTDDCRDNVLKSLFRSVDKDRNGVLNKKELVAMMRKIMSTMSGRQVVDLMDSIDANQDGTVDYNEFVHWLRKNAPANIAKALNKALETDRSCVQSVFRVWDKNGDGMITAKEFKKVMKATSPDLTDKQIGTILMVVDQGKDGSIDYEEFCDFIFPSR